MSLSESVCMPRLALRYKLGRIEPGELSKTEEVLLMGIVDRMPEDVQSKEDPVAPKTTSTKITEMSLEQLEKLEQRIKARKEVLRTMARRLPGLQSQRERLQNRIQELQQQVAAIDREIDAVEDGKVVIEKPAAKPQTKPTAKGDTRKHRVAACKECGREMRIIGHGLCGKCYFIARKKQGAS